MTAGVSRPRGEHETGHPRLRPATARLQGQRPSSTSDRESHGPVYIGGLDRSGKTTMAAYLSTHSNIAIPSVGSNMWSYFYGQFGDLAHRANFERCLDAMLHYKHVRFLDPDPDRIRREFAQGSATYARLFSLFLMHHAERRGKPRWGAQTGLIERYADRLFAAYPGLRVIHMVRDPRDRYEASLSKWPKGKGRAGGAAARWLYSMALAERHALRYPTGYRIVNFESLVTDTERTLREVCDFLGEQFEPTMLSMDGHAKHRRRLSTGPEQTGASLLSSHFIGRYRGRIPKGELAFLQLAAGRRMREHGYAPEPVELTAAERARFVLADLPSQTSRLAAWRAIEAAQQWFPRVVRRRPGTRMVVSAPLEARR
jgi:hypothetical protein